MSEQEKRTPGPWFVSHGNEEFMVLAKDTDENDPSPWGIASMRAYAGMPEDGICQTGEANAEFIVMACNSHDALTAERDALAEEVKRLKAELERERQPWKVRLCLPIKEDPFNRDDCTIQDIGYHDRILVVSCPQASADVAALEAQRDVLLAACRAVVSGIDRYLEHGTLNTEDESERLEGMLRAAIAACPTKEVKP